MHSLIGQTLGGHYHLLQELGGGGFGHTFIAEDRYLPGYPRCVVKLLKPHSQDPALLEIARRLFATEAEVLHQLGDHPQIPKLIAYFEEQQEFFLVQEWIDGEDLRQELAANPKLSETEVHSLLIEILEILAFVHQQQVIHRDVNPRNILRRRDDGKLVLIDFGAVKQVSTQLLQPGAMTVAIGTPGYLPSEQAQGNPRFASDVYAVGMIGIQALTGIYPHQLPKDPETDEVLWQKEVKISPGLAQVLEKMVCYDFRQRYSSAVEALAALQEISRSQGATIPVTLPQRKPKKRSPLGLGIGIFGLLLALSGAGFFGLRLLNHSSASELYQRGNTLVELKRYSEAAKLYRRAVEIQPEFDGAWLGLGRSLAQAGDDPEALRAYEQAIQINPNLTAAWIGRGQVLANLKRLPEAIASYDKAINLDSNAVAAWQGKGDAYSDLQQFESAISAYDQVLKLANNEVAAWYRRGWALHNRQKYEEAISSYEKAIQIKPDYYQAWYNRGNSFNNLNRLQDAVESYNQAVLIKSDFHPAWYSKGNAFIKLQRYEEAAEAFNQFTRLQINSADGWYKKAWSLHQAQRFPEALAAYNRAIALKRNDYLTWYNKGNVLYQLQQYQDAIIAYDQAIKLQPNHAESWFSRGNAYFQLKRYPLALQSYEKAIAYRPDYPGAIQAKAQTEALISNESNQSDE